ncbi:MAG: DUF4215 domain-containing protein [bacterium]|nr:DUF4215 domain-containing protein [bacterium]
MSTSGAGATPRAAARRLARLFLLACLVPGPMAHATVAGDLCAPAADPCVIEGTRTFTAGSVVDVGARTLEVAASARVTLPAGTAVLRAGSVRLRPGARIQAGADGAALTIEAAGDVELQALGSVRARIDLSGTLVAGDLSIVAGGTVRLDGDVAASAPGPDGLPGYVTIDGSGDVLAGGGSIVVRSGATSGGGTVEISAAGRLALGARVDVSGGEFGGGAITLEGGSDVAVTAALDLNGGGAYGDGGVLDATAVAGSLQILGAISGRAAGSSSEGGGLGADVTLVAGQGVTVSAAVTVTGASPDGSGGSFVVDAGASALVTATVLAGASGAESCGGEVDIRAGRDVTLGRVDLSAGGCGGGFFAVDALGTASLTGLVSVDGATSFGSGGLVTIGAPTVNVGAVVRASAPDGGFGGAIEVAGCTIGIGAAGELRSNGLGAQTEIRASGLATIAGRLSATGGRNVLAYRDPALAPVVTGIVNPATVAVLAPDLPPCPPSGAVCGDGVPAGAEQCDDGNTLACDGCSASCRLEACGNGRVECDEECDDGPQTGLPGSACDASCRVIPSAGGVQWIPGGRSRNACLLEWAVRNPAAPIEDGFPSPAQRCIDGDPACDADGASDGTCLFQVAACLAADDPRLPACQPAGVTNVTLKTPNPLKVTAAADVARAAALVQALAALGVTVKGGSNVVVPGAPVLGRDRCTAPVLLPVPHAPGAAATVSLEVAAQSSAGGRMRRNAIDLVCEPNRAVCGNGTIELGEQCDDGNTAACDGCSPACRTESCGDAVVACGEECDDGAANGTPASGCTAACTFVVPALRIPGGGSKATDCHLETAVALAAPATDRTGLPSSKQTCRDGDPACDLDPAPGSCAFATWACVGGADARLGCAAAQITSLEVRRPTSRDGGALAALRAELLDHLGGYVPAGPGEVCSHRMLLHLPADKRWARVQLRTRDAAGRSDTDTLRLRCVP